MNRNDILAFEKAQMLFQEDYNEMTDILYYYMLSYMKNDLDNILFRDEFENITGERDHEFIIDYILNY